MRLPNIAPEAEAAALLKLRDYLLDSLCHISNEIRQIDDRLSVLESMELETDLARAEAVAESESEKVA